MSKHAGRDVLDGVAVDLLEVEASRVAALALDGLAVLLGVDVQELLAFHVENHVAVLALGLLDDPLFKKEGSASTRHAVVEVGARLTRCLISLKSSFHPSALLPSIWR